MKSFSIRLLLFIVAAELIASFAVWHGTPTDWRGQPLSFWFFEMLRLKYFGSFGLAFAGFWLIAWLGLRRHSARVAPALLGAVCLLGTELMTSIYFWRSLSSNQVGYLGWPSPRRYCWEHLISWGLVLVIVGLCFWCWNRWRAGSHGQ